VPQRSPPLSGDRRLETLNRDGADFIHLGYRINSNNMPVPPGHMGNLMEGGAHRDMPAGQNNPGAPPCPWTHHTMFLKLASRIEQKVGPPQAQNRVMP